MKITHQNIDKWLFDYCEGNLTPGDKKQLFAFLEQHPEYKEDLDAWKDSFLSEPVPVYEGADALMVPETSFAWKRMVAACLLLLLLGGATTYVITANDTEINLANKAGGNGNTSKNNGTNFNHNKYNAVNTNDAATAWYRSYSNSVSDKNNRDASSSLLMHGTSAGIHSPNPANNISVTQQSHNSSNDASLALSQNRTQRIQRSSTEGSSFQSNDQAISEIQQNLNPHVTQGVTDEIALNTAENSGITRYAGEEEIRPRESGHLPWQFTRVSDLNPDYLLKEPPRNYGKPEKPKVDLPPTPHGLVTTNVNDHEILQPSLFNFQVNQSLSGAYRQLEGFAGVRGRWIGSEHQAVEITAGFQDYKRKWKSAYGFYAHHTAYMEGAINLTSANLFISPKFKTDRYTWIEPSVQVSYSVMNVSPKLFNQENQFELFTGQVYQTQMAVIKGSRGFFDVNAGVQLQTQRMYAVVGVGHIVRPNITFLNNETSNPYRLPMSLDMTIGTDLKGKRNEELILSPQIGFVAQGLYNRVWGGAKLRYRNVYGAASVSYKGEIFASAGIRTKIGNFAYKFDFSQSALMDKRMTSHGITASLNLRSFNKGIPDYLKPSLDKKGK